MSSKLLICECAISGVLPTGAAQRAIAAAAASGQRWETVPDLCELAARQDARLGQWAATPGLQIHACHSRAVKALFVQGGAPLVDGAVQFFNLRAPETAPAQTLEQLAQTVQATPPANGQWIPWFPVIDQSRCTHCQQCLGFCLFGVYGLSTEGKITVQNPQACKTNCPACARICPSVAIIFPKHGEEPINGAEIIDENLEQSRVKADLQKILGTDVYGALAERRKKARARQLLRDGSALAHAERQAHRESDSAPAFHPLHLKSKDAPAP